MHKLPRFINHIMFYSPQPFLLFLRSWRAGHTQLFWGGWLL